MEIFRTVHGSHLYGLNHEGSDHDVYIVTDSERTKVRQTVNRETGEDIFTVGWKLLLELAWSGSHQSCEALFSPLKEYTETGIQFKPLFDNTRVTGRGVFEKYERTITKFCYGDFKRRRHAVRLSLNLAGLRRDGRFNPVMTAEQIEYANNMARYEGDELRPWLLH